jgi:nuclear transport factor 2 (NTF2) superfamily protein
VRFEYEWRDDDGDWYRSYGNEIWQIDEHGLMRRRIASTCTHCQCARWMMATDHD